MTPRAWNLACSAACFAITGLAVYVGLVSAIGVSINETYFGRPQPKDVAAFWLSLLVGVSAMLGFVFFLMRGMRRQRR
ncbi:hypothetical protein [Caulobacter mirabilis]|uniref:Uncharacterized protein n=1 Tax=Caulobacter mirabilis TaxID=69666 RepID=A0A2D2AZI3_9CAUL|nr:hypothetical protein [Caulobacter mirabilis]ATQ43404.1 hypothetical protein CSW64_13770 [Caulobacter mirabilis]